MCVCVCVYTYIAGHILNSDLRITRLGRSLEEPNYSVSWCVSAVQLHLATQLEIRYTKQQFFQLFIRGEGEGLKSDTNLTSRNEHTLHDFKKKSKGNTTSLES
jgi:hypothetical protein